MNKIQITGSHGVWKSTLLNFIQEDSFFDKFIKLPELAREKIEEIWTTPDKLSQEDCFNFELEILEKQILSESTSSNFIADRGVLDIMVYSSVLLNKSPNNLNLIFEKIKSYLQHQPYDLTIYIPIEFPLIVDNIRYPEDTFQKYIDELILYYIKEFNLPFIKVTGTPEERINQIKKALLKK